MFSFLTYSRSETNNGWKFVSLQVMKFVYLHSTYFLSVLIVGLNITCTNSKICELALDLHLIYTLFAIITRLAL